MVKQLTVRGVPDEVGRKLEGLSRAKGQSVNRTVLEILEAAVGGSERRRRLERYVTWTAEDLDEFDRTLADHRRIDEELWR